MKDRIILDDTPVGNYEIKPIERQLPVENKPDVNDSEIRAIKPGLFESFYESFKEYTPEIQLGSGGIKWAQRFALYHDPEDAPEISTDVLEDFHREYWGAILGAPTATQQDIIKANLREDIADREYLESGSTVGRLAGGIAAFAIPLSWMNKIPLQAGLKTLSASKSIISGIVKSFPGMAGQAILTNTARKVNHESMTLEEWGKDTAADAVFGSLFFGTMSIGQSLKLKAKLKSLNQMDPDISYAGKIGPKGEFAGWEAQSNNGSAGAAKVSDAQKFVDEGLAKFGEDPWFLKVFKGSPVVRGLSSPYLTVREWTGAMFRPSGLLTVKGMTQEGEMSAEQIAKGFTDKAYYTEFKLNELWEESNNIMAHMPLKDSLSAFKRLTSEGKYLSRNEFYEQISHGLRNGDKSGNPGIQKGITAVRKVYDEVYENLVRLEILPPDLDPITAQTYINRVYNKGKLEADQNGFVDALVADFAAQSEEIRTLMGPINLAKGRRTALREDLKGFQGDKTLKKQMRSELNDINNYIKEQQELLNENILQGRKGGIDPILVSERPFFNKAESKQLESLHAEFSDPLNKIKEELDVLKKSVKNTRDRALKKKIKDDISLKKEELNNLKVKNQEALDELVIAKKINDRFVKISQKGNIRLVNAKAVPGLRKPMEPHEAKERALRAYYTITQQNEEQMFATVFKNKMEAGTNSLMSRTLMARDNAVAPWLENDVTKLLRLNAGFGAKKIASETVLRRLGATNAKDGQEAMITKLSVENKTRLTALFDRQRTATGKELKQVNKEIAKQNKDFKKAEQFIKKSWAAFWGNYNTDKYSDGVKSVLGALRNWNAATSLGALPLMQASDAAMLIRNFGFGPVLKEALFPHIASLFSAKNLVREDMAHANLGINTFLRAYGDQLYGVGENYYKRGWLNRFSAIAANKFGNLTGSNQIEDALQLMGGTLSQSKTIAALKKHVAGGTLSQAEHERLFLLGLNKGMAERILAQHKQFGTTVRYPLGAKAYLANYEKWQDLDAANVMLNSIRQEVDATVLRPNLLDVPFCYKDPLMGSLMQFTSYAWASGNQRLLNMIQRPTATKVMGELLATAVGAYINPTREFLEGKEPDFSEKALLASAVTNGFPGGVFVDYFNRANSVFNIPILNEFKSDRFRDKDFSQVLLGAPGSAVQDGARLLNAAFNVAGGGTPSEYDMKKLAYRIPWARAWWLRAGTNAMIEAMELPKKTEKMEKVFGDAFNSE